MLGGDFTQEAEIDLQRKKFRVCSWFETGLFETTNANWVYDYSHKGCANVELDEEYNKNVANLNVTATISGFGKVAIGFDYVNTDDCIPKYVSKIKLVKAKFFVTDATAISGADFRIVYSSQTFSKVLYGVGQRTG